MDEPKDYFKKKKRVYLLAFLIVVGLGVYVVAVMNGWGVDTAVPTVESATPISASEAAEITAVYAPDFILADLNDEDILYSLSKYQGQPIILNFWASWCGPCRVEMPAFQAAHEKYEADGLVILAVNQTFNDNATTAREFAAEMGLTFPLLQDADGRVSEGLYEVPGLPTTIVIRPDGSVAFAQIGPMNDAQIADVSRRLAAGEAVP